MKISHDKFPFYDECVRAFDISPELSLLMAIQFIKALTAKSLQTF